MKKIIGFHFVLKDQFGNFLGSSREDQKHPTLVLTGSGRILPALEQHIAEMEAGEAKAITIPADQAYGEDGWPIIFRVVKIEGDDIYVDANHELAGLTLHYDVEITEKRDATAEEISHGHAHRQGGSCG